MKFQLSIVAAAVAIFVQPAAAIECHQSGAPNLDPCSNKGDWGCNGGTLVVCGDIF